METRRVCRRKLLRLPWASAERMTDVINAELRQLETTSGGPVTIEGMTSDKHELHLLVAVWEWVPS